MNKAALQKQYEPNVALTYPDDLTTDPLLNYSKPKVLFLSPVGFFKGGAERSLQDLLASPYITPLLLAPEEGPILETGRGKNIPSSVLNFGLINTIRRPFSFSKGIGVLKSLFSAALTLKNYSQDTKISIVHSNGLKAHMINVVCRRMGGPKAIIHIRDIPYTKAEKLVWHIMYALCDHMILVSAACWPKQSLPKKCIVIHNGIVPSQIDRCAPSKINKHELVLGFIGRIHPAKGLHLLIDWMAQARKKGYNIKLSIRGAYAEETPEYSLQISETIKSMNLNEHIEFLGYIDDPKKVYEHLDIVVVPSEIPDPLPRSVMEAMARGFIVFGYPSGGILDMIDDDQSGFLVKDSLTFINALQTITEDPKKYDRITNKAREKIEKDFTLDHLHSAVFSVYKDAL